MRFSLVPVSLRHVTAFAIFVSSGPRMTYVLRATRVAPMCKGRVGRTFIPIDGVIVLLAQLPVFFATVITDSVDWATRPHRKLREKTMALIFR